MVSSYMRSKATSDQLLVLGLGAAGALAAVALSAVMYTAASKRRRPAYSKAEWLEAVEEIGTIRGFEEIVAEIAKSGVETSIRPEVWPFLLEVFDYASSYQQRQQQHQIMVRQYQQLLLQCQAYEAAWKDSPRPQSPHQSAPASAGFQLQQQQQQLSKSPSQHQLLQQQQLPEQIRQFAEAHRIIIIDAVRTDFQRHAADLMESHDDSRSYFSSLCSSSSCTDSPTHAGGQDTSVISSSGVAAVANLVQQGLSHLQQYWLGSLLGGQASAWGHSRPLWVSEATQLVLEGSAHMVAESKRQAARMIALLSAYALHDPDTGYCQGMSDLLLPFLLLMDDDAVAFWCFVAVMQQRGVRKNFAVDESGIFAQLKSLQQVLEVNDKPVMFRLHQLGAAECHFAYRMTIVIMRRDMPLHKVLLLWEVLWAKAWQHKHGSKETTKAADQHAQLHSPASTNSSASGKTQIVTANSGSFQLSADSRSSSRSASRAQFHQQVQTPDLFTCFVAAVIINQRRHVLAHCHDADDVLRMFHGLQQVDVWRCLQLAEELQAGMVLHAAQER